MSPILQSALALGLHLVIAGVIVLQCAIWLFAVREFVLGEPDREDCILLIPGSFLVVTAWYVVRKIPQALRTKANP